MEYSDDRQPRMSAATRAPRRMPGTLISARDCCIRLHEYTCLLGTDSARSCRRPRAPADERMLTSSFGTEGQRSGNPVAHLHPVDECKHVSPFACPQWPLILG
jgi:hypothetical protein